LVRNVDGSVCQLENDNGMTNITVFDYSKPVGQKIWLDEVERLVNTGTVDGFYGDTMQVYATENNTTGLWELCKKSHNTCCEMNESTAALYNVGKNQTMEAAYRFLGPKAVFFKITDVLVHGGNTPEQMNATIAARTTGGLGGRGPYVHIDHGDQRTTWPRCARTMTSPSSCSPSSPARSWAAMGGTPTSASRSALRRGRCYSTRMGRTLVAS
jgi:hypothetical protein